MQSTGVWWTHVNLSTIFANSPIEIRAQAQEDRLQILKTLEALEAPDAVVFESTTLKISRGNV